MIARKVLVIFAAMFFAYAWMSLFLIGTLDWAVGMVLSMLCLIANGAIRFVQDRRDRTRIGRDETWHRREVEEILRGTNWGGR